MKIIKEIELCNFDFWGGADYANEMLTTQDFETLEQMLCEDHPDGIDEVELNDRFWFGKDEIAQTLGYDSWEEMSIKRDPDYEEAECPHCGETFDARDYVFSGVTQKRYCSEECRNEAENLFWYDHEDMHEYEIPDWALNYLVNGDATGLDYAEEVEVKRWAQHIRLRDIEVEKDEDGSPVFNDFTKYPAFGLPTQCTSCIVRIYVKKDDE